ncbi:hypothetical protein PMW_108 [Pseudomonas phage phiPMW]|uniref:Uncharacterized protein n=1 Tax=Pseudomonas phage phiPMW TaxID=1815582 RepID=A0A1S5R1E1_9CAUD|nr:hypothetical protein FDG97_gp108 [Pseudomonas phage phiPMW]ANA49233.1 hypothetical protein PMW_108 [Pseudomonas phage phiPMW]
MSFEIGQEVRVIKQQRGHEFEIGDVVRITKVFESSDGNYFRAEYLDGSDWWAVIYEEIELV